MSWALHPFTVHFPVAFLLLNAALTIAYLRRPDPFLERSAYGALVIGWWGVFVAIVTGTIELALHWPLPGNLLGWINAHAALGLALLVVYGQALLRRRRDPRILDGTQRGVYLRLIGLGAVLVLVSGWVGGQLTHTYGFGIPQP